MSSKLEAYAPEMEARAFEDKSSPILLPYCYFRPYWFPSLDFKLALQAMLKYKGW